MSPTGERASSNCRTGERATSRHQSQMWSQRVATTRHSRPPVMHEHAKFWRKYRPKAFSTLSGNRGRPITRENGEKRGTRRTDGRHRKREQLALARETKVSRYHTTRSDLAEGVDTGEHGVPRMGGAHTCPVPLAAASPLGLAIDAGPSDRRGRCRVPRFTGEPLRRASSRSRRPALRRSRKLRRI